MALRFLNDMFKESLLRWISPSTTKMKRRGESVHPCLRLISTLKNVVVDPLIRRTKEAGDMQFIVHETN